MTVGILILVIVLVFTAIPIAGGIWASKNSDWLDFWQGLLLTFATTFVAASVLWLLGLAAYGIVSLWTTPL